MGTRLTQVLLVLAAALAALLAAEIHLGVVDTSPVAPRAPVAQPQAGDGAPGEPAALPPLAALTESVDRPLFSPDRRPDSDEPAPQAQVPAAQVAVEPPPALELSAVVLEDERRMALFRRTAGAATLRALEGETVEGWTLAEVRADGVTLERDGRRHDIGLRTFKQPPAPPRGLRRDAAEQGKDRPVARVQSRPRRPLRGPRRLSEQARQAQ